jgi:glycosyltransferase involved in cell wall biosynthesis
MTNAYSVVIPAHNAVEFIEAAVASVQHQTMPPAEIVVVDDGSVDATADVARRTGATVVMTGAPTGPSAARNRGVAATSAPIICFLDADDEWRPTHAERLLKSMHASGAVFGSSGAERFGSESGVIVAHFAANTPIDIRDNLLIENPIVQSCAAVMRTAFVTAGGYDEGMRMSEDYDLWHRLSMQGMFTYVPVPTVRRRMHGSQLTHGNGARLYDAAWSVRRKYVGNRWPGAGMQERNDVLACLILAATCDIGSSIYRGDIPAMATIRRQLAVIDAMLSLDGRLASIGGVGRPVRSLVQTLEAIGRGVFHRTRSRWYAA